MYQSDSSYRAMSFCRPINTHGRSIILVGMMGSGKTTVGKELSRLTGLPVLDMDSVIEEQIGKSIPDIFKEYGEAHFRALETALLKYLENSSNASRGPAIISTGGGVVLSAQNRAILRRLGYVAWLDVTVDVLIERTSRSANRPLLNTPERFSVITDLCNRRIPLYEEASHIRIETSTMDVLKVVDMVHASAVEYFSHFDQ